MSTLITVLPYVTNAS